VEGGGKVGTGWDKLVQVGQVETGRRTFGQVWTGWDRLGRLGQVAAGRDLE